ncbi:MAG TPA: L-threonylcarbamoyladenylate synthase [Pyrinomonadaceae bacterium]|jgi:L-threonylcarbamoyladenylate synthase|nr:L-threonylcarbamoyladenylate synthase [Pyrinomonadaceae bacterium]
MTILKDNQQTRQLAASAITRGGVIAFLTDTFYGLGADPFNRQALQRINALKGREGGKPILVVLSDQAEAERFILNRSELFEAVSRKHWPGPLTLVVKAREEVPEEITGGSGTVGLRLPFVEEVREFVRSCGGALTATSANPAGENPARTAAEVEGYFPRLLDLIVDAGRARSDAPSTVLDTSGTTPRLIREGAVSRQQLQETLRQFDSNT